jgi:hypothetical protein
LGEHSTGFNHGRQVNAQGLGIGAWGWFWVNHLASDGFGGGGELMGMHTSKANQWLEHLVGWLLAESSSSHPSLQFLLCLFFPHGLFSF